MTFTISTMRQMCWLVAMLMMCSVSGRVIDNLREAAETEPTMDDNTNNARRQEASFGYDIALIQVKPTNDRDSSGILFNNYVQPICLPVAGESPTVNDNLTVSGWGDSSADIDVEPSATLQSAVLPVMSESECRYALNNYDTGDRVLCVGRSIGGTTDVCELDNGGPATYQSGDTHILTGIIIEGGSCSPPTYPAYLTNVLVFRNWINMRINQYSTGSQRLFPPRAD